ncbi:sulfotransferase [Deminuibacter soli]|uniref:Sulfotransferase family protein n=1 Tax=Deminuibacter soli TaxID=2291815 RepID=A0A3E1ND38_9BACT|nr:sulfotransferase [Deminuibacter soli]RFM25751.1 sulfotransferase family protein [Deminuibacter soli]
MHIAQALANWIPYKLQATPAGIECHWLPVKNIPYTDPFFDETISKARTQHAMRSTRSISSWELLPEWGAAINAIAPAALVFHVSRCGSTLITQMLSQLPHNIVLAEVPFFDHILRMPAQQPQMPHEWPVEALLRAGMQFYGARRTGNEQHLFVKTDSWHLLYYRQLRQLYPQLPFILLYRHPAEVVRSHEKRRGMQAVPGIIEPEVFGFTAPEITGSNLNEYMARVLEKYFEQILMIAAADKNTLLLNYNEGAIQLTGKTLAACGIQASEAAWAAMRTRSGFHAKYQHEEFKQEAAVNEIPHWLQRATDLYHAVESLRIQA